MNTNANVEFAKKMNRHIVVRAIKGEYDYDADLKKLNMLYETGSKFADQALLGNIALGIGILHFVAGHPFEAMAAYDLAIEHAKAPDAEDAYILVAAISNKAETYQAVGDYSKMLAFAQAAAQHLEGMTDTEKRGAQFNIWSVAAHALFFLHRYDEARTYAMQVIEATPPKEEIAQLNYITGMMSARRTLAELALEAGNHVEAMTQARLLLGYEAIQNNVIEATISYLTMAHVAERTQDTNQPPQYYFDWARRKSAKIPGLGKRAYIFLEEARYCHKFHYADRAMRLVNEVEGWFEGVDNAEGIKLARGVLEV